MKKHSNIITMVLFGLAAVLLLVSTIGGARAALTYSQTYRTQINMHNIGLVLNENGEAVADGGELLSSIMEEGLVIGKTYEEEITVGNVAEIDEYVRVIIYRYWLDGTGKRIDLSPDYIELTIGDGWVVDTAASTPERMVLYYTAPLASGEATPAAITAFKVSSDVMKAVSQSSSTEDGLTTITNNYEYGEVQVGLEVEAHGVQTHNAQDAILSAWGVNVSIGSDGTLSLGN